MFCLWIDKYCLDHFTSHCTLPCYVQEGRGRNPRQSSLRNRNNDGCTEVLSKVLILTSWANLEQTDFSFLRISGVGRMEPKEKQHEDFTAFMLLGKKCSLKKFGAPGEWVPISDDLLHVNKMGISQPALLSSQRGDETPAGTYCHSI